MIFSHCHCYTSNKIGSRRVKDKKKYPFQRNSIAIGFGVRSLHLLWFLALSEPSHNTVIVLTPQISRFLITSLIKLCWPYDCCECVSDVKHGNHFTLRSYGTFQASQCRVFICFFFAQDLLEAARLLRNHSRFTIAFESDDIFRYKDLKQMHKPKHIYKRPLWLWGSDLCPQAHGKKKENNNQFNCA